MCIIFFSLTSVFWTSQIFQGYLSKSSTDNWRLHPFINPKSSFPCFFQPVATLVFPTSCHRMLYKLLIFFTQFFLRKKDPSRLTYESGKSRIFNLFNPHQDIRKWTPFVFFIIFYVILSGVVFFSFDVFFFSQLSFVHFCADDDKLPFVWEV